MPNRLASETSPYLLQHRDNPVDWYPWGPEALERARAEDRPILLSVGYSACHWCHVMEHESFEDPATAAVMNEHFVNVKVDREERPDIDSIYMTAVQQMTGHGGWPMTMFLTPEGVPFYGGTYYPPEPRHGMPSFRQVMLAVMEAYRERRDDVERSAAELHGLLRDGMSVRAPRGAVDASVLDRAFHALAGRFDARHGGFGGAPKFPQPMVLEFVLRHWKRTGSPEALRMAEHTLRGMAAGGMYDQVGGGFHRYSVDARWLVPHFEKMLYDNALLARVYLYAWQATGDAEYRRVVEEVLQYVEREMRSPEGGFYSAQDADSEGEEGKFYVWTPDEVDALLGPEDGSLFRAYYDVTEKGNFEGTNILHVDRSAEEVAAEAGVSVERLERALARGREVLYEARAGRVWPGRDDKVLTAWNAMMLHTFAEAGRILGRAEYLEVADASADFLLRELRPEGRLLRTWKEGRAKIGAFLEDHALLADALLALYAATGEVRRVAAARELADDVLERFWDEEEGVFYDTATDAEALVVRPRDAFDNATPSGNSAAVAMLLRLGTLTGEPRYARVAARVLEGMAEMTARVPQGFGQLLAALDFHLAVPREVVVVGRAGELDTEALLDVLRLRYLPNAVLALRDPDAPADGDEQVPLLRGRSLVEGRAAAYVCERYACRRPVTSPDELAEQLDAPE
ncbi:MAG TPA: thioredoxin domain-containing protein [Longimicrobiaceae bacterium]|nr:thioredoxin domain-containing protein [Longimicrobiaceae bacterium]